MVPNILFFEFFITNIKKKKFLNYPWILKMKFILVKLRFSVYFCVSFAENEYSNF